MRYSELELTKIMKNGFNNMSVEDEIKYNILNFIHCIYHNKQNFYSLMFDSKLFGDLEMTFKKDANCLIGHCRVNIKNEGRIIDYLFTENGYELLSDVVKD